MIGIPGGRSSESLADALEQRTGFRQIIPLEEVVFDVGQGRVMWKDLDLLTLDGLLIKKAGSVYSPRLLDRLEILRFVERSGVPTFSRPDQILRIINRLSCTVTLREAGIPLPPTVVTEDAKEAVEVVRRFHSVVLKSLYSTKARGMRLIDVEQGEDRIEEEIRQFQEEGNAVLYLQKRLEIPDRDLGVVFLGGEYLGTYARVRGESSWNTTIHDGGRYEAHEPSSEIIELARRAQAPFGLAFTSVDVVECPGGPYVFEVSAFGGFSGLAQGAGINAAELYAEHVLERLNS